MQGMAGCQLTIGFLENDARSETGGLSPMNIRYENRKVGGSYRENSSIVSGRGP